MSTPQNKILEILNKKKEQITKDDKKAIKGMTIEEAEGAFGPQVRGSVETKGTGQYQYQYKTAPSKYLYKDGQLQLGPDNKPLINPLYRTGKLGSVVSAASLALQGVGPQADPFSKLGAIIAGSLAPIFMKGIGADIKYYRATEQIKQENKEAMATSQASARADSTGLKAQRDNKKYALDDLLGQFKVAREQQKADDEKLRTDQQLLQILNTQLNDPLVMDNDELTSFVNSRITQIKTNILLGMGFNQDDVNQIGVSNFPETSFYKSTIKDYQGLKVYVDSNGALLGPVYYKGKLVPSDESAKKIQEAMSTDSGYDLTVVDDAWKRASSFVDSNETIQAALKKLPGKVAGNKRFGLIHQYAGEIIKNAESKDKNANSIVFEGKAVPAESLFRGFQLPDTTKKVGGKKPQADVTIVNEEKELESFNPLERQYGTTEGESFSPNKIGDLDKVLDNLTRIGKNRTPSQQNKFDELTGLKTRFTEIRKRMAYPSTAQDTANVLASGTIANIAGRYTNLLDKKELYSGIKIPEELSNSLTSLRTRLEQELGPVPPSLPRLGITDFDTVMDDRNKLVYRGIVDLSKPSGQKLLAATKTIEGWKPREKYPIKVEGTDFIAQYFPPSKDVPDGAFVLIKRKETK